MKVGFGWSTLASEENSLKEALSQAVCGGGPFSLAFLFATPQYDPHRLVKTFLEVVPSAKLLGCSAEGVIAGDRLLRRGVVLMTIGGEVQSQTLSLPQGPGDPYALGIRAGEELQKLCPFLDEGTVFIFPDPSLEVPLLLQGMYNILGPKFLYLGGGTGPLRWTEKGVNSGPLSLGMLAGIDFSSAVGHGWSPTQGLLVITRTQGRKVLEIDGVAPSEAYRARAGSLSWDIETVSTLHPLGFPNIFGEFLVRDPVYFSSSGHMGFVGASIPKGAVGYVMEGRKEKILATSEEVARRAREGIEEVCFALVFDCISRSLLLGFAFEEELKNIQKVTGTIPLVGFLSIGEIHPYGRAPLFHNKAVVVALGGRGKKTVLLPSREIPQEAELAALHEISAMTFPGSYEEFFQEIVERAVRLFSLQRVAFLGRRHGNSVLLASFGFSSPSEVRKEMENIKDNQCI
ncbi:MAG: FIST signal transduction protein, partial [Candidatus Caldatribacteriaceae bacterium]